MGTTLLATPQSNGSRGPLPVQLDFLDHRMRSTPGNVSAKIPFQRPGWVSQRDWEAFRKAIERGSVYTVTHAVRPTLQSLKGYVRHLHQEQQAKQSVRAMEPVKPELPPLPPQPLAILRGLTDLELRQHRFYRERGIIPWIWTFREGASIYVKPEHVGKFRAWHKSQKKDP